MKSEIAWLMEAFLEEDYKTVRKMIKDRMAEVTQNLTQPQTMAAVQRIMSQPQYADPNPDPIRSQQSPSMQRIMAQNPDLIPQAAPPVSPAAAQALAAREALINKAINGKNQSNRKL